MRGRVEREGVRKREGKGWGERRKRGREGSGARMGRRQRKETHVNIQNMPSQQSEQHTILSRNQQLIGSPQRGTHNKTASDKKLALPLLNSHLPRAQQCINKNPPQVLSTT